MTNLIPLIVYSDVICPWCYVGKRRLEVALQSPEMPGMTEPVWRPFELNPDMPSEGMDRAAYREGKFGAERSAELDASMTETGAEVGIRFAFAEMKRTPNTRLAHRLIWEAGRQGAQNAVVTRLFQAYFEEARDIGRPEVLGEIGEEAGLERAAVTAALTDPESERIVERMIVDGYKMGIQGVPFFILAQKYAVSGAQPPEVWRDALPRIAAEIAGPAAGNA
jgi:predicted DsbA family dithiol-disulfide isomerase